MSGKSIKSLILYGGNATGKSSITDAWEWVVTGKIQHLAREGAQESAYPHIDAKPGNTYVEIEFARQDLGTVRVTYNNKKTTDPKLTGNVETVRKLVAHPCHIRHADLTRFVLFRKSERYDALASLMGFVPQMEYQKGLRRIESTLVADLNSQRAIHKELKTKHDLHFANEPGQNLLPLELMAKRCDSHGYTCEPTMEVIRETAAKLKKAVIDDPNAKKLTALKDLKTKVIGTVPPQSVAEKIKALRAACGNLKAANSENRDKMRRIPLLQAVGTFLATAPTSGNCPVCNNTFDGDLKQHVASELATLQHLKVLQDKVAAAKDALRFALSPTFHQTPLLVPTGYQKDEQVVSAVAAFNQAAGFIRDSLVREKDLLTFDTLDLTDENLAAFDLAEANVIEEYEEFRKAKISVQEWLELEASLLENDAKRKKLVDDHQFIANGLALLEELAFSEAKGKRIREISDRFSEMVKRYMEKAVKDVHARFERISEKVRLFFGILEEGTPGIGEPTLKLDLNTDRSVVLEICFYGKPVSHAYKYLSESQLNSFGLAVSLASTTEFNQDFPFLILDDIVNSCDVEKRTRLIDLINVHLKDFQIILMTHDRFWRDLMFNRLNTWKKLNFTRYEPGVGPFFAPGQMSYEIIDRQILNDEPENAIAGLARHMEDSLQGICEAFEVDVKFKRRGDYTLDPLLTALRTRLKKELGEQHTLTQEITRIGADNAFRNWGIHQKNPESPVQSSEVATLLKNWKAFEAQVICSDCNKLARVDGNKLHCPCGKLELKKFVLAPIVSNPRGTPVSPPTPEIAASGDGSGIPPGPVGLSLTCRYSREASPRGRPLDLRYFRLSVAKYFCVPTAWGAFFRGFEEQKWKERRERFPGQRQSSSGRIRFFQESRRIPPSPTESLRPLRQIHLRSDA